MNDKIKTLEEVKEFLMKHEAGNHENQTSDQLWNNIMVRLDHMIEEKQQKITLVEEKISDEQLDNVMVEAE